VKSFLLVPIVSGSPPQSLSLVQFSAAGFVAERDQLASEVVSEMVIVFVHH
jgi:hypothetical protein